MDQAVMATLAHKRWTSIGLGLTLIGVALGGCTKREDSAPTPQAEVLANQPKQTSEAKPQQTVENPGPAEAEKPPTKVAAFHDVTAQTGITFRYSNGRSAGEFAIVESLGGGVGMFDYDSDGRCDLFFPGGGDLQNKTVTTRSSGLYRNLDQWHFQDVTQTTHAQSQQFFTHGVATGDWDSDGFVDLAISGYGGVQLLKNQGDGTFVEMPALVADVPVPWSSSLAWADLDGNGLLDLYVAHYVDWSWQNHPQCAGQGNVKREVCTPKDFAGVQDVIYFNDGQWPLRADVSAIGAEKNGKGLGVIAQDLNGDHLIDIYVANDTTDNYLYLNQGQGKFRESAVLSGVSGDDKGISTGSMGLAILDANADDLPDILVTNFERELTALYRNDGEALFTFASRQVGLAAYEASFVGFGVVTTDYNFDGRPDIFIANGHVSYASPYAPYRQLPLLLENERGAYFRRHTEAECFAKPITGRGLACGDLNGDGAEDLVVSNLEDPVSVFASASPTAQNWSRLRLVGTQSNRDAIGASVRFEHNRVVQHKYLSGGGSYLSQNDLRPVVYWPKSDSTQPVEVTITWPSAVVERFAIEPAQENILKEGTGRR